MKQVEVVSATTHLRDDLMARWNADAPQLAPDVPVVALRGGAVPYRVWPQAQAAIKALRAMVPDQTLVRMAVDRFAVDKPPPDLPIDVTAIRHFVEHYGPLILDYARVAEDWSAYPEVVRCAPTYRLAVRDTLHEINQHRALTLDGRTQEHTTIRRDRFAHMFMSTSILSGRLESTMAPRIGEPAVLYPYIGCFLTAMQTIPEHEGTQRFLSRRLAALQFFPDVKRKQFAFRGELLDYLAMALWSGAEEDALTSQKCANPACREVFISLDRRVRFCPHCQRVSHALRQQRYRRKLGG